MSDLWRPLAGDASDGPLRNGAAPRFAAEAGPDTSDPDGSLREGEERVRDFIRRHPVPVVLGALALGFAVARLLRED